MNLDEFMEVHSLNQIPSPLSQVVTYFELDDEVRSMAEVLNTYKDSYIFKSCWLNEAKELEDEDITLEDLNRDVFEPCYETYRNIYTRYERSLPSKSRDLNMNSSNIHKFPIT